MYNIIYFLLGICYVTLFIWGVKLYKGERKKNETIFLLFVIAGLAYDNFVLMSGMLIGGGPFLKSLNMIRFWIHMLFTPTLILFIWRISHQLKLISINEKIVKIGAYFLTVGIIIYEYITKVMALQLQLKHKHGVIFYEPVNQDNNILLVIVVTIVVGLVAVLLLKKFQVWSLLIGVLIVMIGGLLTIWMKKFPIMNLCELFFIGSLMKTKMFQMGHSQNVTENR